MPGRVKLIRRWRLTSMKSAPDLSLPIVLCLFLSIPLPAYSLDLLQTLELARSNDPVYLAAEASYLADTQETGKARADLLPSLDASASAAQNDDSVNGTQKSYPSRGYDVTLRQTLFNWRQFAALKQAKATVRRAAATYAAARQDLIKRVAIRYFGVLAAEDDLELAKADREANGRQLEVAQGRLDVGLGTITDVHQSRARYELAVARVLEAENTLADARQALRELIGELPSEPVSLKKDMPLALPDPSDVQVWIDQAQAQNFSLVAANEDVEIARRELSIRNAGHVPSLDLVGSHSRVDTQSVTVPGDLNSTDNSVALSLTIPILQGGRVVKEADQARYQLQASEQDQEATRRNVVRTTRSAFLGIKSEASRVRALEQSVIAAESALEAKRVGYQAGINTNVEVLDAQRDFFFNQRDLLGARYSYIINTLNLKEAVGSLSEEDLKNINGWLE